ncbi:MAG: chromate transporter [Verrucomicrobia bacterium]|nr:chromate transporter [Verrucomicrobiota bacterium]
MSSFPYLFWLRMGLLSWGGPGAQIALLEQECVEKRRWLTSADFTRALGLCMFLPGPEAQQLVAWIAWRSHGWRGAAVATLGFVLPGLIACGVLAWLYAVGSGWELLPGVFAGARAAVAGVILVVGVKMLIRTCEDSPRRIAAGLSFTGLCGGAPFIFIALSAGLHGWYIRPDDEEALPPVSDQLRLAVLRLGRFLLPVLLVYLALWLWLKHSHGYVQLVEVSLFAVLTSFGGAYAALGIWRVRANALGWLGELRFGDALVVGEATPGPLLLAGSFVAFLAGFNGSLFAEHSGPWFGLLGLVTAAVFTFVPSTLVILACAPLVEEGVGDRRFHDALGMVAAVAAGAIAFLGCALCWTQNAQPLFLLVSAGAAWLFYKEKFSVPALVGIGAVIGLFSAR